MTKEAGLIAALEAAEASKARCVLLTAQIEALAGDEPWTTIHFGRPDSINACVDVPGFRLVFNADTAEEALTGLLATVRNTLTQEQAA